MNLNQNDEYIFKAKTPLRRVAAQNRNQSSVESKVEQIKYLEAA